MFLEITIRIVCINKGLFNFNEKAIWPSGKAVDCKSSIPSSSLGVALINNVIFINMKLKAIWPSGKAVDCKFSIPSSNLGVALTI